MATISTYPQGRMFQFTVEKRLTTNPARTWVNNYKMIAISAGVLDDLVTAGRALAAFELTFHHQTTDFTKWRVSTAAHDSTTYNPEVFYEEAINLVGQYVRNGDLLALDVGLWVQKNVLTGRQGRQLYRNCLIENDVEAGAGQFTGGGPGSVLAQQITTARNQRLGPYLSNGSSTVLRLCLYGPTGQFPRIISDIAAKGIMVAKNNHRYFDRKPSTNPAVIADASTIPADYDPPEPADFPGMFQE